MANERNKIEVVLALLDKITAPIQAINRRIEGIQAPIRKVNNKMQLLAKAGGLDKLTSAVGGVGSAMEDVASQASKLAKRTAAGIGIFAGALFGLVKMTSDAGDASDELSTKAGVSAGFFQKAAYAASFASIEQSALAASMAKMNSNIVAAITGNKEMQVWFRRAGISMKELRSLKPEQIFSRVIDKVKELPKEGAKAGSLMRAIYGKSGADMLPMVESFDALTREAEKLGLVLSDDAVKAGAEFNDTFDKMMKVMKGVGMMIGSLLMPHFNDAAQAITKFALENRELIKTKVAEWIERASAAWPKFKQDVLDAWGAITTFASTVSAFSEKIGGLQTVALIVAGVIAGPLLMAIAALAQAFVVLGVAMLTTPFGWIIAAVAGIVAVGALLYANFESLGGMMQGTFGALGGALGLLWKTFKELADMLAPVVLPLLKAVGAILGGAIYLGVMAVTGALQAMMFILSPVASLLGKVMSFGGTLIDRVFGPSKAAPAAHQTPSDPMQGFRLGPPAGVSPMAAAALGGGFHGVQTNNAKVEVDFKNVPRGTEVRTGGNNSAPLDLSMGYAMMTP